MKFEPLRSGLPDKDKLVIELLKLRATMSDTSGVGAAQWAQEAVKGLSLKHSMGWISPLGTVELTSESLEALNWVKEQLEKANADST